MNHYLKIKPEYLDAVLDRRKPFEIRYNDRNYQVGDVLVLQEYDKDAYTGFSISVQVSYITDFQQKDGYVVMGIRY